VARKKERDLAPSENGVAKGIPGIFFSPNDNSARATSALLSLACIPPRAERDAWTDALHVPVAFAVIAGRSPDPSLRIKDEVVPGVGPCCAGRCGSGHAA